MEKMIDLIQKYMGPQSFCNSTCKYYAVILSKENIINCISPGGILNKKTLRQKILLRIIQKSQNKEWEMWKIYLQ